MPFGTDASRPSSRTQAGCRRVTRHPGAGDAQRRILDRKPFVAPTVGSHGRRREPFARGERRGDESLRPS